MPLAPRMLSAPRLLLACVCGFLSATAFGISQKELLDPELRELHARGCAVYHGEHDRDGGMRLFKELEALATAKQNTYWWSSGLWKQAQVFGDEGNPSESVRLFNQALEVALRAPDYAGTANHLILLRNIFAAYERLGQRGESLRIHRAMIPATGINLARTSSLPADTPFFDLSDEALRQTKNIAFISILYATEITLRFESGDDADALALAEKMDRRLAGTTHRHEVTRYAIILESLVDIHLAAGRTADAEQTILRLLDLAHVPRAEAGDEILEARIDLALLRARQGADTAPLFVEMQSALDALKKNRWMRRWLAGRGKLAHLHALAGDYPGASRHIDSAIAETRALNEPRLLAELLLARVDLRLTAGVTEGVQRDLFEALTWFRRQGGLRAEAAASVHYARLLRMNGLATRARSALARAEISLRRFPDASLRELLDSEARALAATPSPPATTGPRVAAASPAVSDLQPVELRTRVSPSWSGRGRFTLTNPGALPVTGVLEAEGVALEAAWDPAKLEWRLHVNPTARHTRVTQRVALRSLDQATIVLTVDASLAAEGKVRLLWRGEAEAQSAWWYFSQGEIDSDVAVIDANLALENPFYSVPLHHYIVRPDGDSAFSQNLRVLTDRPCRVELVAADTGRVLAVDATGDGDFTGVGDVIFADGDHDGLPDLRFERDARVATLEIQVYPISRYEEIGVKLELQDGQGAWRTGATDRLIGK